jgi:translation elongation factor EF-1alpha
MEWPGTPVSTKLAEEINKVNLQYQEGAITANELCCKLWVVLIDKMDSINEEYKSEQAYWEAQRIEQDAKSC